MSMRGRRQLPKGWAKKQLKDVCTKVEYGTSAKSQPQGNVPVVRMGNIQDGGIDWANLAYTSDQEEIDKYLLKYNDVLFNRTNSAEHVGKAAIYKGEMPAIFAGYLIRIHRKEELIDADFLNYYLNSDAAREYGRSVMSQSVNQANINGTKLKEYPITVPPIAEQKQIVAILDEAFEGIDSAIANTEKNLANVRELFESYLNAIFTRKGDDWFEKKVSEIGGKVFTGPFGSLLHKADYISDGIPIVNPANIEDGQIVPNWKKTVSPEVIERLQSYVLSQNDIVIGRRGEIGRCAVVREEHAGWLCGSGSFFIKTFENVDSDFLVYLFSSAEYRSQLEAVSTGATMQNLSNQALSGLVIAMPPLTEQKRVTAKLEDLKVETQRLKAIYQQKLAALNELKQSILQRAFSGELTAEVGDVAVAGAGAMEAA